MPSQGSIWFRVVLPVVGITGVVFGALALLQADRERRHLHDELERRARALVRALAPQAQRVFAEPATARQFLNEIQLSSRTLGVLLCREDQSSIAVSPTVASLVRCDEPNVARVLADETEQAWMVDDVTARLHAFALRIHGADGQPAGAVIVVHDASYIDRHITSQLAWFAAALALLALLLSVTMITSVRATFGRPLELLAEWMHHLRVGDPEQAAAPPAVPSKRLAMESERLAASLKAARTGAQSMARQAADADRLWTRERLRGEVVELLDQAQLVVVSNREPYMHRRSPGQVRVITPASGLVTALDPVLRACGGLWVAHGAGEADRETADARGRLVVPPEEGLYTLRRIWLSREEEEGYYYGFSNEGLWPLCHAAHQRPAFREDHWRAYVTVNERFARAVLEEIGSARAAILVQDFHLALVPWLLKRERPDLAVSLFWHIPWPNPEAFRICPWKTEILQGILGADLVAFHIQYHCNNFLDTVDQNLEVRVDWEKFGVWSQGRMTEVRPLPISIQPWEERAMPAGEELESRLRRLRADYKLGQATIAVGVDRIDYTKGIPDRIRAISRFLELNPSWIGRFVFVELGAPSRVHIQRYRDLVTEVEALADEINWKFQTDTWKPIIVLREHHPPESVYLWQRLADLCIVSSLHDGMNLVAKEFVSAREDEQGVLILSEFTGAARELTDALIINPYATEEFARAIQQAVEMPAEEQRARMKRLRQQVADRNVYLWARDLISGTARLARRPVSLSEVAIRNHRPAS